MKRIKPFTALCLTGLLAVSLSSLAFAQESASPAILSIHPIGIIDADGAKLSAIAVEYAEEVDASYVSLETYEIENYSLLTQDIQTGDSLGTELGVATRVYVNDVPEQAEEGKDTGKYVVIEVNTDYLMNSVAPQYEAAMAAGVKQISPIKAADGSEIPATDFVRNYEEVISVNQTPNGPVEVKSFVLTDKDYVIPAISGYQLFTKEDGTAFHAEHVFESATGEYVDVDIPYALFVPADYDASQRYALVIHIHDAGFMGNDPMITLTEGQGPANYASDEIQQLAKDQGLGGIIVVCPQFEDAIRTARDNWTLSCGAPATWQLLDYLTEAYSIDENRIYATGQSMGGMQLMAMASHRDNYFAGLWLIGMQWGNNYNLEEPYKGNVYYVSDDPTIWRTDDDGNDSDLGRNWYYLLSDDNVLFTSCLGDGFGEIVWGEMNHLYEDIAGVTIPRAAFSPINLTVDEQNEALEDLLAVDSGRINYHWSSFDGGSHMLTWVYGHRLRSGYEWLLSQTRESEHEREKLAELNRPWTAETDEGKIAEKQTEDRKVGTLDGEDVYLAVPAEGAGTIGYNSAIYDRGGAIILKAPGWVPAE